NRVCNLIKNKQNVSESISDTLNDMANYCTMLAIGLENTENANDTRS
ncbi:DUF1599 domain-containing protein, partial [Streptococcus agalactiae]|nr:DUF1599 domain-containing protein [Streptococcus agalactiae]